MNLDNRQDRYDLVSELNERCASLISSYDLDMNDWGLLKFYMGNLSSLRREYPRLLGGGMNRRLTTKKYSIKLQTSGELAVGS